MTVSTIASIAAGISRTLSNQNIKVASSVQTLVSRGSATAEISTLTAGSSVQAQISILRAATQNVAQASTVVGIAQNGASQIDKVLSRLRELSARASGALSADERRQLDLDFQALRGTINRIVSSTTFNGRPLLDGSLSSEALQVAPEGDEGFAIGDLRDESLLGGDETNLLTQQSAQNAEQRVQRAQTYTTEQRATLDALDQGLALAFASLDSAGANQEAARSVLNESDFATPTAQPQAANLQAQASAALQAQTSKLPNNILALLSE